MPRRAAPPPLAALVTTPPEVPGRLVEVLDAGLGLVAERGVAGASLRELARRVGMSQPSLYHYFATKDELIARLVDHGGQRMYVSPPDVPLPTSLVEMPAFARASVLHLYTGERHTTFVRFMFVISTEKPEYRSLLRALFVERIADAMARIGEAFAQAEGYRPDDVHQFVRMIVSAMGLPLIEERVLFGARTISPALRHHIDFIVEQGVEMARRLPRQR